MRCRRPSFSFGDLDRGLWPLHAVDGWRPCNVKMHDARVLGVSSGGPERGVLSTLLALVVGLPPPIPPPFPPPVTAVMSHHLLGRLFQCFLLGVDGSVNARGF